MDAVDQFPPRTWCHSGTTSSKCNARHAEDPLMHRKVTRLNRSFCSLRFIIPMTALFVSSVSPLKSRSARSTLDNQMYSVSPGSHPFTLDRVVVALYIRHHSRPTSVQEQGGSLRLQRHNNYMPNMCVIFRSQTSWSSAIRITIGPRARQAWNVAHIIS